MTKHQKRALGGVVGILLLVGVSVSVSVKPGRAQGQVFQRGDVFVSVSNGMVQWRRPDGTFVQTLNTTRGGFTTGMAFDSLGRLYVTNFSDRSVSRFDTSGNLLGLFVSGFTGSSVESIVFDLVGNALVGSLGGTITRFDANGNLLETFNTGRVDFFDLAADQRTVLFGQEGTRILRFDLQTRMALSDFATNLGGQAYALRIRSNGEVLLANGANILRLDANGNVIQTYDTGSNNSWFGLNLDPDGTSFWSADFGTANVVRFDIATGNVISMFNTDTGSSTVFGLGVFGEITVGGGGGGGAMMGPDLSGSFRNVTLTCRGTGRRRRCTLKGEVVVQNLGASRVPPSLLKIYLSANNMLETQTDTVLRQEVVPTLASNQSTTIRFSITFAPGDDPTGQFLILRVDDPNAIVEDNETNNVAVNGPIGGGGG